MYGDLLARLKHKIQLLGYVDKITAAVAQWLHYQPRDPLLFVHL